jgi:hypothetical protein
MHRVDRHQPERSVLPQHQPSLTIAVTSIPSCRPAPRLLVGGERIGLASTIQRKHLLSTQSSRNGFS